MVSGLGDFYAQAIKYLTEGRSENQLSYQERLQSYKDEMELRYRFIRALIGQLENSPEVKSQFMAIQKLTKCLDESDRKEVVDKLTSLSKLTWNHLLSNKL